MPQKTGKLKKNQTDFIEIFEKSFGLISVACKKADIDRKTYYRWLENPLFAEKIEEKKESFKDFGESALYKKMQDGDMIAIREYNRAKNKDRGYGIKEVRQDIKQEVHHTGIPAPTAFILQLPSEVEDASTPQANA